jgi:hypothetical protein
LLLARIAQYPSLLGGFCLVSHVNAQINYVSKRACALKRVRSLLRPASTAEEARPSPPTGVPQGRRDHGWHNEKSKNEHNVAHAPVPPGSGKPQAPTPVGHVKRLGKPQRSQVVWPDGPNSCNGLSQDNIPVEVAPRLYIGSIHAAFNQEAIVERGITHVSRRLQGVLSFVRRMHDTYLKFSPDHKRLRIACDLPKGIHISLHRAAGQVSDTGTLLSLDWLYWP